MESLDAHSSKMEHLQKKVDETTDISIPKSLNELKNELKESLDANSVQFKDLQRQCKESLDANSSEIGKIQKNG